MLFYPGGFSMTAVWLVAMIVLLIIEGIVPGLVSIWFAIGAFAAMISAILGAPLWLQVLWVLRRVDPDAVPDKAVCEEIRQLPRHADERGYAHRQGVRRH